MTLMQKVFWFIAIVVFPVALYLSWKYWPPGYAIAGILGLYVLVGLYDLWYSRFNV